MAEYRNTQEILSWLRADDTRENKVSRLVELLSMPAIKCEGVLDGFWGVNKQTDSSDMYQSGRNIGASFQINFESGRSQVEKTD